MPTNIIRKYNAIRKYNHYFTTIMVRIDLGKKHQCMLKLKYSNFTRIRTLNSLRVSPYKFLTNQEKDSTFKVEKPG